MKPYLQTPAATLYHARAEEVYPHLDPGSVSMIWSDGPYAMNKAEWDRMGVDGLADWYAPHVEAWGRVCAPSATVYLWNTAEGWARIDPVMRAAGWVLRNLIVWMKPLDVMRKTIDYSTIRMYPDVTEVCGFYQRNAWDMGTCAGAMIGEAAGKDERNAVTAFLRTERESAGMTRREMATYFPSASGGLTGCVTNWEEGFNFPTWEIYQRLAAAMVERGEARERPYLVHPSVWPAGDLRASYDHLRASYDHLRSEYDHLRAEYEAARVPFTCPVGVSNVWPHAQVAGKERLKINGETHPCQKPLAFADRAIRASTRIGDTILDPFAGTNRIAVACRLLPAEEARRAIGIEMEQRWLDAVRPSLVADHGHVTHAGQPSLFARSLRPDTPSP